MQESWDEMEARHVKERIAKMQELLRGAYLGGLERAPPPKALGRSLESINALIAEKYQVSPSALLGTGRRQDICDIRHEAWVMQKNAGYSLSQIGRKYSNRDHTTIRNGIKRSEERNMA